MERTLQILQSLFNNTELIYKMSVQELRDVLELSTIVLADQQIDDVERQKAYLVCCVAAANEKLPLKERWSMYWSLVSEDFTSDTYDVCHEALEGLYAKIYESVERMLPAELKTGNSKNNGPVVIVTNQFTVEGHAPTRRVLDYATTIADMGFEVVIINDSGMNIEAYSYNKIAKAFTYVKEYEGITKYSYKGREFKFYQNPKTMLDSENIANMIYNIKKMNPCLVFNVGASCITSDLCRFFTKTVVIPCATSIATSMSDYIILGREIRESDRERIERGLDRQTIIESVFNYIFPYNQKKAEYSRQMFGIPESAWLIATAGSRMNKELSGEFMLMMDKVMDLSENVFCMIIGPVECPEKWVNTLKHRTQFIFPGGLDDGSEAIRLANVYVQPKRKGGGRAAFEALHYGIPALIPAYGDAWDVCGTNFEVHDYEEMGRKILRLREDEQYYQEMAQLAIDRAAVLEDMPGMIETMFKNLDVTLPREINVSYTPIFSPNESEFLRIENNLAYLKANIDFMQKRLRELEWAEVFNSSTRGKNWLKDVNISPGRNALSYAALYTLYRTLDEVRPSSILELGLGQSTRVISEYAKNFCTEHFIVEHDESWINFFLGKNEIADNTQMVHLEREEGIYKGRYVNSATPIKFYRDFAKTFAGKRFDMIFVDGPQGSSEISRVDITEILPEALKESFVIMVDDSERLGESRTVGVIAEILQSNGIPFRVGIYDDMKDTTLIVSEDYGFLLSL